jgi:SAM-dependent methyltransferase
VKVISFSLFGTNPMYRVGAVANVRLAREFLPAWTCRFYTGRSVDADLTAELIDLGAQVFDRSDRPQDWSALMWRYESLTDTDVEAHLFRDCDSRLTAREASAVAEWLASGLDFHIIRDHPEHAAMPMLAGMWGATAAGAALVAPILPAVPDNDHRFVDQLWLREHVYPLTRGRALVHDEFGVIAGEHPLPVPATRRALPGGGFEFIGQAFEADGTPRHPDDAHRLNGQHEWRLFDEGAVPEYTTAEWYVGRESAPHLEQDGHRDRLMQTAAFVAQAAFGYHLVTVVDLGCGDGGLLSLLGSGLKAWGYDLSPANVEASKDRGVDVRYADVLAGEVDWGDIAVATEMLEHLVDPHAFVSRIAEHARVLVCSSPADERPGRAYEFHTWCWDELGYRQMVERAGFIVKAYRRVNRFQVMMAVRPYA